MVYLIGICNPAAVKTIALNAAGEYHNQGSFLDQKPPLRTLRPNRKANNGILS